MCRRREQGGIGRESAPISAEVGGEDTWATHQGTIARRLPGRLGPGVTARVLAQRQRRPVPPMPNTCRDATTSSHTTSSKKSVTEKS